MIDLTSYQHPIPRVATVSSSSVRAKDTTNNPHADALLKISKIGLPALRGALGAIKVRWFRRCHLLPPSRTTVYVHDSHGFILARETPYLYCSTESLVEIIAWTISWEGTVQHYETRCHQHHSRCMCQ